MMINGEGMIGSRPNLKVVRMTGWNRGMTWENTGLRWYQTSPNIPHARSPIYYVATGILGSASGVDVGIGTDNPFGYAGGSGVKPAALAASVQRLNIPGVSASPYSKGGFGGVKVSIDPHTPASITGLDIYLLSEINRQSGGRVLGRMHGDQLSLFNKVCGSDSVRRDLMRGRSPGSIVSSWSGFESAFRAKRQRYLAY
jgi:uncharacterized protein YbbC (DUF1343 family)